MSKNDTIKELASQSEKDALTTRTQDVVGKIFGEMEELVTKFNSQLADTGISSPKNLPNKLHKAESEIER